MTNGQVLRGRALRVNPIACDGRGLCTEIAPELIRLDDWGYPIVQPGPVPPGMLADAEAAVRICPLLALRLASPKA
jgi:ferredoxin